MNASSVVRQRTWFAMLLYLMLLPFAVQAQVNVTIDGNVARATLMLPGSGSQPYEADVTITFDTPQHLTPQSLNLSAVVVSPSDPTLVARLPLGTSIDADFPVLITVEPPTLPYLFASGFDSATGLSGNLSFRNAYEFEVHTHNLTFTPNTPYRIFKAPLGGMFFDITADVLNGSVRGRGRSGGFSQFLLLKDTRPELVGLPGVGVPVIALLKLATLETRIVAATLDDVLRLELANLLGDIQVALIALDYATALLRLDQLIARVDAGAGTDIANIWRAERDLANDAGDIHGLAKSLRFSIVRLQGGP